MLRFGLGVLVSISIISISQYLSLVGVVVLVCDLKLALLSRFASSSTKALSPTLLKEASVCVCKE